jgi:hypothetical protein
VKVAVLTSCFALVAFPAAADICGSMPKAAAEQAVTLLPKGTTMMEFCSGCGDKVAKGTYVMTATAEPESDGDYEVKVNGTGRDLGYVYILGGRNKQEWTNLGLTVKCSSDVHYFDPKVLPKKVLPALPPSKPREAD